MSSQIPRQRRRAAGVRSLAAHALFQAPGESPASFALVSPKTKTPRPPSKAEETLALHIRAAGLPVPVREFIFHPTRKWRFDFAFPDRKIGVEVQGMGKGGRMGGHQTAAGMRRDCDKANAAKALGWVVFTFTTGQVRDLSAIRFLQQQFEAKT